MDFQFLNVRISVFSVISTSLNNHTLQADENRKEATRRLLDRFLDPYLQYLEQFTPVQPAVLLLKEMAKNGTIHDTVFKEMEEMEMTKFFTVCHK